MGAGRNEAGLGCGNFISDDLLQVANGITNAQKPLKLLTVSVIDTRSDMLNFFKGRESSL